MRKVWDLTFLALLVVFTGYLYWAAPGHPKVDLNVYTPPSFASAEKISGLIIGNGTNLALQVGGFETSRWSRENIGVIPNAGTAPNGTKTAAMLVETNTSGRHRIEASLTGASPGLPHTLSLFVKPGKRSGIQLEMRDLRSPGKYGVAICDLQHGVVPAVRGDVVDAGLQELPDGWFRCWATMPYASDSIVFDLWLVHNYEIVYSGDGSSGLLVWGPQFEVGANLSGYSHGTSAAGH